MTGNGPNLDKYRDLSVSTQRLMTSHWRPYFGVFYVNLAKIRGFRGPCVGKMPKISQNVPKIHENGVKCYQTEMG